MAWTEQEAINVIYAAVERLIKLGWHHTRESPVSPFRKRFRVIEIGSTGIFNCQYYGEWPEGYFMTEDDHDVYPTSHGVILWRETGND